MENITIKQNKRSKKLEINIENHFTVECIEELKTNILDSLDSCKHLSMNFKSIENIDISGLQFIYSLQKEATYKEINFELTFEGDEEIKNLLKKTGFENFIVTNNNN